jgi:hypothetical protein
MFTKFLLGHPTNPKNTVNQKYSSDVMATRANICMGLQYFKVAVSLVTCSLSATDSVGTEAMNFFLKII